MTYIIDMKQVNRKIREVCSSIVLARGNKLVLLYDHSKKYHVLPQGHKKKKETLSNTALREAREETGFQDLSIVRKLGRYQYHFDRGNKTIYKTIHVYLIKTISDKRIQNTNKNFTIRLFLFKNAIKVVKWKQDRKYIALVEKFLKI